MAKAIFVSPKYIKQKSIVSGNVDPDKMIQFIETAQDIHVQNYLGSNLYIKLQNIVDDGTIDDLGNEAYRTLLTDFIKPMLIRMESKNIINKYKVKKSYEIKLDKLISKLSKEEKKIINNGRNSNE